MIKKNVTISKKDENMVICHITLYMYVYTYA